MTSVFAKNQLVWAKIKGYPWWPAVVGKSNEGKNGNPEKEVLVYFVGENSHASIPNDKVYDFKEKYDTYATQKNKKLQECIKIALKIQNGVITYDGINQHIVKLIPLEERQSHLKKDQKEKASSSVDTKEETTPKAKKGRKKSENNEKAGNEKTKNDEEPPKPSKDDDKPRAERSTRSSVKKEVEDESPKASQSKNKRGRKPKNTKEEDLKDDEDDNHSISDSGAIDAAQLKKNTGRKLPVAKVNQKRMSSSKAETKEEEEIESEEEQVQKKKKADNNKPLVYNDRYIKKLIKDLKTAADGFYKKFKNDESIDEDDTDLAKVIDYMGDMDSNAQFTADLVTSDAGKLFKTIYMMAAKYEDNLPKKSQNIVADLQQTLHVMKNKILKFHFDNEEYLEEYDILDSDSLKHKADEITLNGIGSENPGKEDKKRKSTSQSTLSLQKTFTPDATPQKKDDGLSLRRKICQKLAKLIQNCFNIEKDKAQEVTLLIEGKIHSFFSDMGSQYKTCIKALYKSIKDQVITIHELHDIQNMTYKQFTDNILSKSTLDLGSEAKDDLKNDDDDKDVTPRKEKTKDNDNKDSESDK